MLYKLADLIEIKHGYAFPGTGITTVENDNVLITPGNFKIGGGFKEDKCKYFIEEIPQEFILQPNDLIVTMTDLSKNGDTLGYSALVPENTKRNYLHNQRIGLVQLKSDVVLKDYVYWFMRTKRYQKTVLATATGSTVKHTAPKRIQEIEIDVPDKGVQASVCSILNDIDRKIQLNDKLNANLEEMGLVLYKKFFINEHQESWIKGTIVDLGAVVGGSTPSKSKDEYYCESGIPWITPKDLSKNKNKFIERGDIDITELGLQKSSAKVMPAGTVLFSSRAPIGYIAIAKNEVTTNQGFKSVVPNENIGTAYIYYFLKYNLEKIENMASGSTFKEVSGTTMKNIEAIIPDEIVLKEFNMLCMSLFKQQEILEEENQRLMDLRDILLPKLMSGDIDLSEVEVLV